MCCLSPTATSAATWPEQVPEKDVLLNDGCCPRHDAVSVAEVQTLRAAHPEAEVLAHPECTPEVLAEADYIGSTSGIIARAEASEAQEFIVLTVRGVGYELHRRCPGKRFFFPPTPLTCADMDSITLGKVARCLETGEGAVELDASAPASLSAKRALDRMLELAGAIAMAEELRRAAADRAWPAAPTQAEEAEFGTAVAAPPPAGTSCDVLIAGCGVAGLYAGAQPPGELPDHHALQGARGRVRFHARPGRHLRIARGCRLPGVL